MEEEDITSREVTVHLAQSNCRGGISVGGDDIVKIPQESEGNCSSGSLLDENQDAVES